MEPLEPIPQQGDIPAAPDPADRPLTTPAPPYAAEPNPAAPGPPHRDYPPYPADPGYPAAAPWGYWPPRVSRPRMDPNTVYRPGPWFYLAGIATVLSGLVIGSLPSQTFGTAWVWLAGGVLAFVWFVAFVICANESKLAIRRVHWARWAGIPALGVLFVAISATNLPVETRFGLSRGALDQAAASARAGMATGHGWVGLIPVDWVRAYPDGVVIAQVTGSGGCGFANFSGRWPALNASVDGAGGAPLLPLDGDWWTWCHYQSFD